MAAEAHVCRVWWITTHNTLRVNSTVMCQECYSDLPLNTLRKGQPYHISSEISIVACNMSITLMEKLHCYQSSRYFTTVINKQWK